MLPTREEYRHTRFRIILPNYATSFLLNLYWCSPWLIYVLLRHVWRRIRCISFQNFWTWASFEGVTLGILHLPFKTGRKCRIYFPSGSYFLPNVIGEYIRWYCTFHYILIRGKNKMCTKKIHTSYKLDILVEIHSNIPSQIWYANA